MAQQQPEGVYIYIDDNGARFVALVDAYGEANMLPWKQQGQMEPLCEKTWNLNGDFIKLKIAE